MSVMKRNWRGTHTSVGALQAEITTSAGQRSGWRSANCRAHWARTDMGDNGGLPEGKRVLHTGSQMRPRRGSIRSPWS